MGAKAGKAVIIAPPILRKDKSTVYSSYPQKSEILILFIILKLSYQPERTIYSSLFYFYRGFNFLNGGLKWTGYLN